MLSLLGLPLIALTSFARANPIAQGIEWDVVNALPSPSSFSIAVGAASQVVSINQASVASALISAISADPTATTLAAARKRQAASSVCSGVVQPTGSGPVPSPDTASAFLSYSAFAAAATNAPVPAGWTQVYQNLDASNNAYYYLGYSTLTSYNSTKCAAKCAAISGCQAINIYFERDPTVAPNSACSNPPSTTNIKCVYWGAPLDVGTATNTGQYQDDFQVVIAGSNAYNLLPSAPAGYTTPQSLGAYAINAPLDCNGDNTYMGVKIFQNVAFNVSLCAAACTATSNYDVAQGIPSASDPQTCQFFNTYMLYKNGAPYAQYCSLYNQTWNATWATNNGGYSGSVHYTIEDSYVSSNATNPGVCTLLPSPYSPPEYFYLAITSSDGTYTGQELALVTDGAYQEDLAYIASDAGASPTVFTLNSANNLQEAESLMLAANQDSSEYPQGSVYFDTAVDIEFDSWTPLSDCAISTSGQLSCTGVYGGSEFSYCENYGLALGSAVDGGCTAVTVQVIAASGP